MAVDGKIVRGIIADYQNRYVSSSELQRNRLAFRAIKEFRNSAGDSTDESLAAAEHYLFARYMVSNSIVSENQMIIMVVGYDGVKAVAQTNSYAERAMRHNPDRATSKVSTASVAWGLIGASDGETARLEFNPGGEVPRWNWDAMKFGGVTDNIAEYGKAVF
jgi:hypothetical protein